jgi:hypothetical protein
MHYVDKPSRCRRGVEIAREKGRDWTRFDSLSRSPCSRTPITPLRWALTRDPTDRYAGNFTITGLALCEPPMIGFKRAGVTAPNSRNRPRPQRSPIQSCLRLRNPG